ALDFAREDKNTLVIVTADHETGGMSITGGSLTEKTNIWSYTTKSHSANMVGVFSYGPGSERFTGVLDNTDIAKNLFELLKSK
ncbi:MAG: alkaline phosphatase, partial [Ignavibacteriales bacterium]|nr:alkaline phosphatase [Ignavibacteriales bacterium]